MDRGVGGRTRVRQRPPWIQTQLDQGYRPYSFYVEYQKTTSLGNSYDITAIPPPPEGGEYVSTEATSVQQRGAATNHGMPEPTEWEPRNKIMVSDGTQSRDERNPSLGANNHDNTDDGASMLHRTGDSKPIRGNQANVTVEREQSPHLELRINLTSLDTHMESSGHGKPNGVATENIPHKNEIVTNDESEMNMRMTLNSLMLTTVAPMSRNVLPATGHLSSGSSKSTVTTTSRSNQLGKTQSENPRYGLVTQRPTGQRSVSATNILTVSRQRPTTSWLPTAPVKDTKQSVGMATGGNTLAMNEDFSNDVVTSASGIADMVSTSADHQVPLESNNDVNSKELQASNESGPDELNTTATYTDPDEPDNRETIPDQTAHDPIPTDVKRPKDSAGSNSTDIPVEDKNKNVVNAMEKTSEVITMETTILPESRGIPCLTQKNHSRTRTISSTTKRPSTKSSKKRNRNRKRMRSRRPQTSVSPPSQSMGHGVWTTHRYPMYPLPNPSYPQVYFTLPPFTPAADHSVAKNATFSLAGMTSAEVTGVAIGCIVAFWVIIGPLVCIICRMRDKAKEKRREREQDDSMSHTLIEEMIRMELARGRAKMYRTNIDDEREIERLPLQGDNNCFNTCSSNGTCVINPQDYVIGNRYNLEYTPVNLTTVPSSDYEKEYNIVNKNYIDSLNTKAYATDTNL